MPSGEPGESGWAPAYGTYVGSRTPPTTTGVPEAEPAIEAVGAAPAAAAAAVGLGVAATLAVGAAAGALVGADVGAGVGAAAGAGAGALHAANSGRPTEPAPRMRSAWRRVGRRLDMLTSVRAGLCDTLPQGGAPGLSTSSQRWPLRARARFRCRSFGQNLRPGARSSARE